ncbi:hypothetical protein NQZ68_002498 [Dissostichus eleginoides]|nr:hypothetical protein NQZ68_002498 [Dissostichus eleginoides]
MAGRQLPGSRVREAAETERRMWRDWLPRGSVSSPGLWSSGSRLEADEGSAVPGPYGGPSPIIILQGLHAGVVVVDV